MAYKPRLTIPESGNPYYNTKANGGYSNAIQGSPVEPGLDVLRNCVGYAYGRFNEIGKYGCMKYLKPVNAEQFIIAIEKYHQGLTVGMTPKLGACMVWGQGSTGTGGDGAGHVAIVEQINPDGSIVTSESGWRAKRAFWTQKRTNADGRWGQGSKYNFLGFIYNPAVPDEPSGDFEVGEIVNFLGGNHHTSANDSGAGTYKAPSLAKITDIYPTGKYPYHVRAVDDKGNYISGVYGWVAQNTIAKLNSDKADIMEQINVINNEIKALIKKRAELEALL